MLVVSHHLKPNLLRFALGLCQWVLGRCFFRGELPLGLSSHGWTVGASIGGMVKAVTPSITAIAKPARVDDLLSQKDVLIITSRWLTRFFKRDAG